MNYYFINQFDLSGGFAAAFCSEAYFRFANQFQEAYSSATITKD